MQPLAGGQGIHIKKKKRLWTLVFGESKFTTFRLSSQNKSEVDAALGFNSQQCVPRANYALSAHLLGILYPIVGIFLHVYCLGLW